jgi:hypothetical protein
MIQFITSDPRFNIVSLALAILGIILAIIFYYRSKSIKNPCYSRTGKTLIDCKLMERNPIEVTFLDEPVETLTITYVALWNNGRATISRDDIAVTDPLRIVASDGCTILAADIVCENRPTNKFEISLQRQDNAVVIDFDFIDYKDGMVVRLYHVGKDYQDIDVRGTVKGASGLLNVDKTAEFWVNTLGRLDQQFKDRVFRRTIPKWLLRVMEKARARQNLIFVVFASLPLLILLTPFVLVYMLVMSIVFFIGVLYLPFVTWRYRLPEELYVTMYG